MCLDLFALDRLTRAWLISPHRKRNRRHPQQRKKHDWLHSSTRHRINGSRLTSSYHSQYQCLHSFLPCSLYVLSDSRLIYTIATVHSRHVSCHLLDVWSFWCPIQTQPSYIHTTSATDLLCSVSCSINDHSQTRVQGSHRGGFRPRGGGAGQSHIPANYSGQGPPPGMSSSNWHYLMNPDKEPPPGYICFRCGSKGEPLDL